MSGRTGKPKPGDQTQPKPGDRTQPTSDETSAKQRLDATLKARKAHDRANRRGEAPLADSGKRSDTPPPLDRVYPFSDLTPSEKQDALKTQEQYNRLYSFRTAHAELTDGARKSTLGIDNSGNLAMHITSNDLPGKGIPRLVRDTIVDHLKGQVEDKALETLLGKTAPQWVGLLKTLSDLKRQLSNERLAGAVGEDADEARFRVKIRLLTTVMATQIAHERQRQAPSARGYNPQAIQLELYNNYWDYDKAYKDHASNIAKDKALRLQREDPQEYERLRREPDKWQQG
jgi:hypothetical protein